MEFQGIGQALDGTAEAATRSRSFDREAFLKLLVAQLRHQDPLDPTDSREFITQLSQLSGTEQLIQANERLANIELAQASIANAQLGSLVGRSVTASNQHTWLGGSGGGSIAFDLGGPADQVDVSIRDESGKLVRTLHLGAVGFPGLRQVEWDGLDETGKRAAAGRYSVEVRAVDAEGRPVPVIQEISGTVEGISFEAGVPELVVGGVRIRLGDVIRIAA